jgi:hypothetical protein
VTAHHAVLETVQEYFSGLYAGDTAKLRSVFHEHAVLWGEVKGQPYLRALEDWLRAVRDRKSPQALGEPFAMEVIAVAVHGAVAVATVRCPMLGYNYLDLLSLLHHDGTWRIASKVFTDIG